MSQSLGDQFHDDDDNDDDDNVVDENDDDDDDDDNDGDESEDDDDKFLKVGSKGGGVQEPQVWAGKGVQVAWSTFYLVFKYLLLEVKVYGSTDNWNFEYK